MTLRPHRAWVMKGMRGLAAGVAATAVALFCLGSGLGRLGSSSHGVVELQGRQWSEFGSSMDNVVPTGVAAGASPHALSGSASEHHAGMLSQESVVRSARDAARHGWENVHVVHAADGDDNRRVPDLGTLIGAYKQVARMGDAAGRIQGRGSAAAAHSGRSAATLQQAADSLDAIAASMGHRGHLNPVGHARGESAWDRDHPMMLQRGRVEAGGNDDRGEARMVQEQHHSLMEEHVLSHTAMLRPINLTNCTNCSYFEPFEFNEDGSIKLNAHEMKIERDVWRRLFGDRYSHGFCQAYHGRAHCRARANGMWNYDAQTYRLQDPFGTADDDQKTNEGNPGWVNTLTFGLLK